MNHSLNMETILKIQQAQNILNEAGLSTEIKNINNQYQRPDCVVDTIINFHSVESVKNSIDNYDNIYQCRTDSGYIIPFFAYEITVNPGVIEYLINKTENINITNDNGYGIIHLIALNMNLTEEQKILMIAMALDKGADINALTNDNNTLASICVEYLFIKLLQFTIDMGGKMGQNIE